MRVMAVLIQLSVGPATQDQFDELDAAVDEAMSQAGGPPQGLMAHIVYPEGDGFVVAGVWRTQDEGRAYVEGPLRSLVNGLGLSPLGTVVRPVWSFARP